MKKISYSAPAKVILSGEHAVVYGKPALVTAINLRLTCTAAVGKDTSKNPVFQEIITIIKKYLHEKKERINTEEVNLSVDSQIPVGRGLGSSAALSVASAASIMEFLTGQEHTKEEINNCAYRIEKFFHKNASGVDPTTSCFGGLIYYRKEFEFLKTFSHLHAKIPKKIAEKLILIDTGAPLESTALMVQKVGEQYNKKQKFIDSKLTQIEKTTKRLVVSLIKEDELFFKETLAENQKLLEKIGVVSEPTKNLLHSLSTFGVGKVTGAGGRKKDSGFILFYTDKLPQLKLFLEDKKIYNLPFTPSVEGVKKTI